MISRVDSRGPQDLLTQLQRRCKGELGGRLPGQPSRGQRLTRSRAAFATLKLARETQDTETKLGLARMLSARSRPFPAGSSAPFLQLRPNRDRLAHATTTQARLSEAYLSAEETVLVLRDDGKNLFTNHKTHSLY